MAKRSERGSGAISEPGAPAPVPPNGSDAANSWTVGGLLDWTAKFLSQKGAEFPRLDTEMLLAHALGCQRIDLYGQRHGETAPDEVRRAFKELVRRRLEGCPVAYLVGRKEFFSLSLEVSPAVLIPRPDTELLVMECLKLARAMSAPRILDVGTGSGNIAVAVAKQHGTAVVTAIDICPEALAVARRNAERLGVGQRIRFLVGDLLDSLGSQEQFELILSNPPYIPREELKGLPAGVRDYEPHLALDGGVDGFGVFERLVDQAPTHLAPGGHLMLEIGAPQEGPARQRIASRPHYELAETVRDFSGHPRVLRARLRGQ